MANETYTLIQKTTLNASAASITFSSIPQTFTDLVVKYSIRGNNAQVYSGVSLKINGSTTTYSSREISGDGASAGSATRTSLADGTFIYNAVGASATASTFSNGELYIPNYTSSNYKSISNDQVSENNATEAYAGLTANLWSTTSAITSLQFVPVHATSWDQYSSFSLYGVAKSGVVPASFPKASGGDIITNDGTYWYHAFLNSGTFTPSGTQVVSSLMVAGGGGGGAGGGGGGGAGGLLFTSSNVLTLGTPYTVQVGGGGALNTVDSTLGNKGSSSVISGSGFTTLTAEGGGGGGSYVAVGNYSNLVDTQVNGGSGGGSRRDANNTSTLRGLANGSQGNNGGLSTSTFYVSASGGGGAGAVGGSSGGPGSFPDSTAGSRAGGIGLNTYSTWASATGTGASGYYAGGGGGSAYGTMAGVGGTGGGGTGANYYSPLTNGTDGTVNTGGGGGGGSGSSPQVYGRAGGSGIVIIRYTIA